MYSQKKKSFNPHMKKQKSEKPRLYSSLTKLADGTLRGNTPEPFLCHPLVRFVLKSPPLKYKNLIRAAHLTFVRFAECVLYRNLKSRFVCQQLALQSMGK